MYVEDAQTQDLPKADEAKARIAKAMNYPDWAAFLTDLHAHRKIVAEHFDATFSEKSQTQSQLETATETAIWQGIIETEAALKALKDMGYCDATQTLSRLQMLRNSNRYQQLPERSRQRFDALMPLVIWHAAQVENADDTLLRSIILLENICRRASYLALLTEFPQALQLVIKLCAASPWLAQYLAAQPILLDELLDTQNLYAAPDFAQMAAELSKKMADLAGDVEAQMDAMRHFKQAAILRFAAQDVAGKLPLETLSDYLSALADTILTVSLQTIWQSLQFKNFITPQFAVIGYGKLGGKELGYVSDLDIIFLYDFEYKNAGGDDVAPQAVENSSEDISAIYARFAQRINNWFNSLTSAGLLYETDLQLRPDGNSGLLVSTVAAFRDYQLNKAWVWEHQAITRARFIAGDASIGAAFEQIRVEVLMQTRDVEKLKAEVLNMREKMRAAQSSSFKSASFKSISFKSNLSKNDTAIFELKNGVGGIIDVEFLVQFLVLAHANQYPQLTANIGNIALLKLLATLNIIQADAAEKVANAYREYRKMQHALKLQGMVQTKVEANTVVLHIHAVSALWQQVFTN